MKNRILVIDDEKDLGWAICEKLEKEGYEPQAAMSGEEGLSLFGKSHFDLVIVDYLLPGKNGMDVLKEIKAESPRTPAIFITAHGDHDLAWKCLELGADEYINKPFNLNNLSFLVYKILKNAGWASGDDQITNALRVKYPNIAWRSLAMEKVVSQIDAFAKGASAALITGESGSGKELVASTIHHNANNPRRNKPFLTVNCAAVPEGLMESELFGHARGSFPGALLDKKGVFENAGGGAVFLDEITSAPPAIQAKLLRLIDTGEFTRIGDQKPRKANVCVIAASAKDPGEDAEQGRLARELYHRLKAVHIELPPLRDRREDIDVIANFFLSVFNHGRGRKISFDKEALRAMREYPWPGNAMELKNTVQNAVQKTKKNIIGVEDLPDRIAEYLMESSRGAFTELKAGIVESFEKKYFSSLLLEARGNVSEAARLADMARVHLIRKLKALGLDPKKFK